MAVSTKDLIDFTTFFEFQVVDRGSAAQVDNMEGASLSLRPIIKLPMQNNSEKEVTAL
jgi:hypothetical protein